jgi:GDP-mannose 6-dehydrogenase
MLITAGYQLSIFDQYVTPQNLIGQNLGALSNSPFIRELLVDQSDVESTHWDLVIDSRGTADRFELTTARTINISKLA